MNIVTFLLKNGETPNWLLVFLWKNISEKSWKFVEDFDEKSYNNNGKPLEIVEDYACEAKLLHFCIVHHVSSFFVFSFLIFF